MKKNLVIGYCLDGGFESCMAITEKDLEGLNYGFLEINDFIGIDWLIENYELSEDDFVDSWYIALDKNDIKKLAKAKNVKDIEDLTTDIEVFLYDKLQNLENSSEIYNYCLENINDI